MMLGIEKMLIEKSRKYVCIAAIGATLALPVNVMAQSVSSEVGGVFVPMSRAELIVLPTDMSEILIADPSIADVHVVGSKRIAFIGKAIGRTNAKIFDKNNNIIRQFDVVVGYDLPSIRKALHNFLPNERIAVELVNNNIALTGTISDAATADKAVKIVSQFVTTGGGGATGGGAAAAGGAAGNSSIVNFMKIKSGQQVLLRVRVGEIRRSAAKNLGASIATNGLGNGTILGATNNKQTIFDVGSTTPGINGFVHSTTDSGFIVGTLTHDKFNLSLELEALETEGVYKLLAEPDLVAISGEKAEFLAGGQFPVATAQASGAGTINTTTFQNYGISVQFLPLVLSDNRIRISVDPEVSEIDKSFETATNGTPGLTTRHAKTTVELAPGESFMIAGLTNDNVNSGISQIPGASSIPILGSLLRQTTYSRDENELIIVVTPYIVDPLKSSDVKLPSDDFRPPSLMEQFFYGELSSMSGSDYRISKTPLEGPLGFITD